MLALAIFIVFGQKAIAQQNMWGSGFYQGGMVCPYDSKVSKAAVSMSDEEKEERKKIKELKADLKLKQLEKKRAEKEVEYLRKKIERHFDSSVSDFLLDTHIEGAKNCDSYRTAHPRCNPQPVVTTTAVAASGESRPADQAGGAPAQVTAQTVPQLSAADKTFCDGLSDPPELLKNKWNSKESSGKGNYCIGSSKANAGSVHSSICSDTSLRPSDAPKYRSYNVSECSRALADYRKKRIELANAADKEERINEEISDRTYAISDARERAKIEREYRQTLTEGDCEECDQEARGYSYQKPKRDWMSTLVHVGAGLGMMYMGKKAEEAANEYNAQAGWPSQQSYGYPFYAAGTAGVINGLVGPGAYGCSGGYGGAGFPFGAGGQWGLGGSANGAFGPFAGAGGAFGYPQGMFGSPWGGGMYNPGFGIGGQMNGPFGGFNFGGPFGFPNNGSMVMCIQAPCNPGQGQFGNPFGSPFGGQFGVGGQFGSPFGGQFGSPFGGQFGSPFGGQLGMQYQMQMMQMQQQMQQQYYQQQQQYYQAQMQYQMQMQQRQQQAQQQAMQIQMQMAQLNMQLQQLYMQSGYGGMGGVGIGGGFNIGGGFSLGNYGGSFNIGAPSGGMPGGPMYPGGTPGFYPPVSYPPGGNPYNPYPGPGTGVGTGTGTGRGR